MRPPWNVEVTEEFDRWWLALPGRAQESIAHDVELLRAVGPSLGRPWVDAVRGSRHGNNPRRSGILLVGGDKAGDPRFYGRMIRAADALYDRHLDDLRNQGPPP